MGNVPVLMERAPVTSSFNASETPQVLRVVMGGTKHCNDGERQRNKINVSDRGIST